MILFPQRRVLIGREAMDLHQRLMANMGQWLCVCVCGEHWWMERSRKDGLEGTKAGIHIAAPLPATIIPSKLFSLPLNGLFFPVCSMNYVNDEGIHFFSPVAKGRKDWSERNASSSLFFFLPPPHAACEPLMSAVWARGFSSAAMWKDDGGCLGQGRGRVSAQWHTWRAEKAAWKRMLALLLDGLTLINEIEKERQRENKKRGVALV